MKFKRSFFKASLDLIKKIKMQQTICGKLFK